MEKLQNIPKYIIQEPFRFIEKYEHVFNTYAKGRWLNKTIVDVFKIEFQHYPIEYYINAIQNQMLTVNGKKINTDYILKHKDLIRHSTFKIEEPCLNLKPVIIFEDDNFFVINKPPHIQCHAKGEQFYNSIEQYLKYGMGFNSTRLYLLHRLDKLTSGVLIFSKNKNIKLKYENNDLEDEFNDDFQKDNSKCNEKYNQQRNDQETSGDQQQVKQTLSKKQLKKQKRIQYQQQKLNQIKQQSNQEQQDQEKIYEYEESKQQQNSQLQQQYVQNNIIEHSNQNNKSSDHSKYFKEKTYLARVQGIVDFEEKEVDILMYCQNKKTLLFKVYEGSDQDQINLLQAQTSKTLFKKLWVDQKYQTSLIQCKPLTGRTNQIRLHLSFLGFPIINDIKYGAEFRGNYIIKNYFPEIWNNQQYTKISYSDLEVSKQINNQENDKTALNQNEEDLNKQDYHSIVLNRSWNFRKFPMEIFLHSYKYQIDDYIFQTEQPYWTDQDFELN